jgi:hypothetical protein
VSCNHHPSSHTLYVSLWFFFFRIATTTAAAAAATDTDSTHWCSSSAQTMKISPSVSTLILLAPALGTAMPCRVITTPPHTLSMSLSGSFSFGLLSRERELASLHHRHRHRRTKNRPSYHHRRRRRRDRHRLDPLVHHPSSHTLYVSLWFFFFRIAVPRAGASKIRVDTELHDTALPISEGGIYVYSQTNSRRGTDGLGGRLLEPSLWFFFFRIAVPRAGASKIRVDTEGLIFIV